LYKAKNRNKYGANRVEIDGYWFDSQAEGWRYLDLKLMEKGEMIRELAVHPRYNLDVNGYRIAFYKPDFRYYDVKLGQVIVEDVKGGPTNTPVSKIKQKLMKAIHGIDVKIFPS